MSDLAALLPSGLAVPGAMRVQVKRRAIEIWAWHRLIESGVHAACDETLAVGVWPVVAIDQVPAGVTFCRLEACFGAAQH